ncbi:hypothetical protein P4H66_19450 [Paenibacillus dokdonensis]|uniref:Uncharacterized protein n=1 Tax=Paenibacillus dokdonensis TaxID=2567944 RepID=A0ABU6GQH0_9BACL|nr:hypothetical protein [Paenibacillus dokdonensis]MEC0241982.1 hypothetical protein [Paenibacillus dokdonensis]
MSLKLIDAIQNVHKHDPEFMSLVELALSASSAEIVKRFTKGMEPEIVVSSSTVPHICQYIMPGRFAPNPLVFEGKFCLDFYGKTAYEAKLLFEQSFKLLHDKQIQDEGFRSYLCVLAFDADFATGIKGVKGYKAIYDVDYLRMN